MEKAHEGLIANPSTEPERVCVGCHKSEVEAASTGLHQNLNGHKTVLEERGADFTDPHLQEGFDNHCYTCHASCGECHISRPSLFRRWIDCRSRDQEQGFHGRHVHSLPRRSCCQ